MAVLVSRSAVSWARASTRAAFMACSSLVPDGAGAATGAATGAGWTGSGSGSGSGWKVGIAWVG